MNSPSNQPVRLLIAEDEEAVREVLSRGLTLAGYDVTCVADGLAAWEKIAEQDFDLLLSDIVMPHLDGIALALKVAQDYPRLPVLLMSGYAAERQRAHNLETLVHEVIAKPFTLEHLKAAIERNLLIG